MGQYETTINDYNYKRLMKYSGNKTSIETGKDKPIGIELLA